MKIILSIIFVIILTKSYGQDVKNKDPELRNDSYDNFKNSKVSDSLPFLIFDERSGDIIFKTTLKNGLCKQCYDNLTTIAENYKQKERNTEACKIYTIAFRLNGSLGKVKDRYNAAICFSKIGQNDSAFIQLSKISIGGKYNNLDEINGEEAFKNLHNDLRWKTIIEKIKNNVKEFTDKLNSNTEGHEINND